MKIVCVDDHPVILKGLSKSIQQLLPNASVNSFGRAEDALGFAKKNGCDVLISEIELGGINGIMLAKKIKKLNPKVNIIFLTVCDEREHAKEVLEIRPSGYLVKPANNEQLALELNNLRYAACAVG
jgi:DNA-binding NarL/FixJ family response regulator